MSAFPLAEFPRSRTPRPVLTGGLVLLAVAATAGLCLGAVAVPVDDLPRMAAHALGVPGVAAPDPLHVQVVGHLRAPRVLVAMLVGAALAVSGTLVQGWFRNPLAEPGLLGVSGGASFAAAAGIVLVGDLWGGLTVPVFAFAGGLGAVALVHALGRAGGGVDVLHLLLAGLAVTTLAGAGTGLLITISDDDDLRDVMFWTLGSVGSASWSMLAWLAPALVLGLFAAMQLARPLDGLLLGEATARHLGIDVDVTQRHIAVLVAWLVGVSVAATGLIGFLGLVAPHIVRHLTGPRHRRLLPATAIAGAALLAGADVVSRTAVAPLELPIGILTTLLGGPLFLGLLLQRARRRP